MIPVISLDQVRVTWIEIQKEGYILFGFLLYADTDRALIQYVSDGLIELDIMSGVECAIFVIDSPSKKWIRMAERKGHLWWRLFGAKLHLEPITDDLESITSRMKFISVEDQMRAITNNRNSIIQIGNNNSASFNELLDPNLEGLYDRNEAYQVARHFNIQHNQIPCLVFFNNLEDKEVKLIPLEEYDTYDALKKYFRNFFSSERFSKLLFEAKIANGK